MADAVYNVRMPISYKGYRMGTIEKGLLQLFLGIKDIELPKGGYGDTFADILTTARQKRNFSYVIHNLKKKKLVTFKNRNGEVVASLTRKGKNLAEEYVFAPQMPNRPKVWDRKWHIVIFDIPQKKHVSRNLLRHHLKRLGFIQVQASVWAYPFPCEEIVTLIKSHFELGNEVLYLRVDSLENDNLLRKKFKLN